MRILRGRSALRCVHQLAGRSSQFEDIEPGVRRILSTVREEGDRALRRYASRWDGLAASQAIEVPAAELEAAWHLSAPTLRDSLRIAAANIRNFAERQKPREWSANRNGATLGQVLRPLEAVGCYVPGGRYPLMSSVLMTVIPAQVAGVEEICVVSPRPPKEVLAAIWMLGISHVYRIGGAQAIGALAYGTQTVRRVDKIVGPGNAYVTVAKKLVSFDCAIDFLAGPTEVVILANRGRADFVAADLVAQAEHDLKSIPILITSSENFAEKVARESQRQAEENPLAKAALRLNGRILIAESRTRAIEWANLIAPEHISIEPEMLPLIRNAGSIFVGPFSAQAAGDYASGPNHVLPTAGGARFRGGLSVLDFLKVITVQKLNHRALAQLGKTITTLAEAEGLQAHAESIRVRCKSA